MQNTVLITDTACDLSPAMLEISDIEAVGFPYTLDGQERLDDSGSALTYDEFYDALRAGARSTTMQVSPIDCLTAFERAYDSGRSAVMLTISSGLSASYDTAVVARQQFLEKRPDADIYVVDSQSVSAGQGLLVLETARRLAGGMSAEAVAAWVEENRLRANAVFTVDTFEYLVRGGRVPAAVGAVGSVLNIKPVLHVDAEGRLAPLKRVRGHHHALAALSDVVAERIENPETQIVIVDHAQCPEDAAVLRVLLAERIHVKGMIEGRIGTIIGTHTGPSGLVVAFWGRPRGS
jgi:DegV family protein with EDD domain